MRKGKRIGDNTSITITDRFVHIRTGETINVTPELLEFINTFYRDRKLASLVFSGIWEMFNQDPASAIQHKNKTNPAIKEINEKLDKLLKLVNENQVTIRDKESKTLATNEDHPSSLDDLQSLVSNFTS